MSGLNDEFMYCERCGYNLTGCPSSRCPECGEPFNRSGAVLEGKPIRCPACRCNLTWWPTPECPMCGRTFDRAEMLRRANWTANYGAAGEMPLLKLSHVRDPGGGLWADDLSDGPARLRPF